MVVLILIRYGLLRCPLDYVLIAHINIHASYFSLMAKSSLVIFCASSPHDFSMCRKQKLLYTGNAIIMEVTCTILLFKTTNLFFLFFFKFRLP